MEFCVPLNVPADASSELCMEIEVGGVLTLQGDQITVEGHIIADENSRTDCRQERQAFVTRRANTNRCAAFLCHPIICVNDTKELRLLDRKLLLDDSDTTRLELAFESRDEVVVRDRRPGLCGLRSFEGLEAFTVDILRT